MSAPAAARDPSGAATDTHCPYCSLQCGMQVVDGPEGPSVAPRDFPTNAGGLCRKGWT